MSAPLAYGPPFPHGLTHDADKQRYYAADSYFAEAFEQLSQVTTDPVGFATGHALLLIKPDAIASRSVERITGWLRENDFRVVGAQRLRMTRGMVRAMWHYQLNRATPQRCLLADALCQQSDSLLLLLRPPRDADVPATVALSTRKGPADPTRRQPGQLRTRLGDFGFLLNLVHASDEPADLIRELGILLTGAERRALCVRVTQAPDRHDDALALARQLYAEQPPHELRFAPAADRLRRSVEELLAADPSLPGAVRTALRNRLAAATDEPAAWGPLVELIWEADLPISGWDVIVVGNGALPLTRPHLAQLLAGPSVHRWQSLTLAGGS